MRKVCLYRGEGRLVSFDNTQIIGVYFLVRHGRDSIWISSISKLQLLLNNVCNIVVDTSNKTFIRYNVKVWNSEYPTQRMSIPYNLYIVRVQCTLYI